MQIQHRFLAFIAVALWWSCGPVAVAQQDLQPDSKTPDQVNRQVQQWIEKLGAPRFSERAKASLELQRLGAAAIKPLEKVVLRGDSESAHRALGILKRNYLSDNPNLTEPASEAIGRIAGVEAHPLAAAAQRILSPPEPESPPSVRPRAIPVPVAPMNIQVQIKSVNGKQDVLIKENGREFRFRDEAGGIAVERPDGNGGVKRKKYKDVDELKTQDPEAHRVYERYAGKGNRIQIQIGQPFQQQLPRFQFQPRIEIRPRRALPNLRRPAPQLPRPAAPQPPQGAPLPKLSETIEV